MSFSVDLWNGFDIIKSSFIKYGKKLSQLIEILSSYSAHIKDIYTNLDNLYQTYNKSNVSDSHKTSFDDSLIILVASFKIESEMYKNHYNSIINSIKDIKEKLEKIKNDIPNYFNTNMQNKENFNAMLNNLIEKKENFNKACKDLCLNIVEEESNKILEEKNKKDKNFLLSITSVFSSQKEKKEIFLKKALEAKKEYINLISESNEEREKYNKETDIILSILQNNYKDLIYYFEYLIKAYNKDKIDLHQEILESNKNSNEETYQKINYKNIFNQFIEKNVSKEFPMIEIDFIPFKLIKSTIENQKASYNQLNKEDQNKIFNDVKSYINNNKINYYETEFSKLLLNKDKLFEGNNLLKGNIIVDNNNISMEEMDDFEVINDKKNKELKEKKNNFKFIKDFIYTLIIEKTESKKNKDNNINNDDDNNNINEDEEDESIKYNQILIKFMELISPRKKGNFEYLNFFIKYLTINRSAGFFKLNKNVFQIFINIFTYILMNYKNSYDYIKNIIILAQTFYRGDEKDVTNKIYLLNGLKDHTVFNEPDTWHRAINYSLSLSLKNSSKYSLNINNKEEYLKNLNKVVMNNLISYLYDLKICTSDANVYDKVKKFYSKIYNLNEKLIDEHVGKLVIFDKGKEKNDK